MDPASLAALQVEPGWLAHPPHRFSPLMSWLVSATRPALAVELGPGDRSSLISTCESVLGADATATCVAVHLANESEQNGDTFTDLLQELSQTFGAALLGFDTERAALEALVNRPVSLVHLSLFDAADTAPPDIDAWLQAMAPGGVIVITTTASDTSSGFAKAKGSVMDNLPAVSMSLGLTTEAIVAQRPLDDGTPIIDLLRKAPFAIGAFLSLFGEQMELHDVLHNEPEPSPAVRALIGRVVDQQVTERETFVSLLHAYKEETARLSAELASSRDELAAQSAAARQERERLVGEFLDRLDHLSSKISTSASRYESELTQKDALLADAERRVGIYAGLAADAQSVVDDMRRSSSWRATAPIRLLSRVLATRKPPPAPPEN